MSPRPHRHPAAQFDRPWATPSQEDRQTALTGNAVVEPRMPKPHTHTHQIILVRDDLSQHWGSTPKAKQTLTDNRQQTLLQQGLRHNERRPYGTIGPLASMFHNCGRQTPQHITQTQIWCQPTISDTGGNFSRKSKKTACVLHAKHRNLPGKAKRG